VDNNFFGTQMSIAPLFTPFLDEKIKLKNTCHTRKQLLIGNGIKFVITAGIQILNWADSKNQNTLHRPLMLVESIHTKTVVKVFGNTEFKGRFFTRELLTRKQNPCRSPIPTQTPTKREV